MCMTFIFCSLVELAIIGYMVKEPPIGVEKRRRTKKTIHNHPIQNTEANATSSGSYVKCPKHFPAGFGSPSNLRNREREGSHVSQSDSKYILDLERYNKKERRAGCCRTCYNLSCPVWTPDQIDRASCVIFPTLFSVFNIVYWSYYITLKKLL